jgi:hypothetical protein
MQILLHANPCQEGKDLLSGEGRQKTEVRSQNELCRSLGRPHPGAIELLRSSFSSDFWLLTSSVRLWPPATPCHSWLLLVVSEQRSRSEGPAQISCVAPSALIPMARQSRPHGRAYCLPPLRGSFSLRLSRTVPFVARFFPLSESQIRRFHRISKKQSCMIRILPLHIVN